jgi:hypothetical protein
MDFLENFEADSDLRVFSRTYLDVCFIKRESDLRVEMKRGSTVTGMPLKR